VYKGYEIIDADGHVQEPEDLWAERLPASLRERAPWRDEQRGVYRFKDQVYPRSMASVITEANQERSQKNYKASIDANWDAPSQVAAMDEMGLDVSYLYPTRGLGMWYFRDMEPDLATAMARVYNDYLYEFTQHAPDRLRPIGGVALQDPEAAAAEALRCANELGMRAIFLRPNPVDGRALNHPDLARFWATCEDAGLSIGIHEGSQANVPHLAEDRLKTHFASHTSHALEQMVAFLTLLEGGVFEAHPRLRFAFLEAGCGWLPYWLWRLDEIEYKSSWMEVKDTVKMKPSEYFRRQCDISAEPEPYLGDLIGYIGADRIIFGSDYPHPDHGPDIMDELIDLENLVTKPVLQQILRENPLQFYGESR
jgi:predicted TIM-barrel fold metal-dependent hydrolase